MNEQQVKIITDAKPEFYSQYSTDLEQITQMFHYLHFPKWKIPNIHNYVFL